MNTYVILRRDGWKTGEDLQRAAERSMAAGEEVAQGRDPASSAATVASRRRMPGTRGASRLWH